MLIVERGAWERAFREVNAGAAGLGSTAIELAEDAGSGARTLVRFSAISGAHEEAD